MNGTGSARGAARSVLITAVVYLLGALLSCSTRMPTLTPANAAIASMRIAAASLNGFINGPPERLDSVPMRLRFGAIPRVNHSTAERAEGHDSPDDIKSG